MLGAGTLVFADELLAGPLACKDLGTCGVLPAKTK